ncbi:MAG: preprotein translocase subunit SecY [Tissierellia bacterium]|nr:preprotein translocase subunit SecY [Tissierellia bacterium]
MLKTLKEAWKLEDIRKRIIFTFLMIIVFRLGNVVPVPFIDKGKLAQILAGHQENGIISLMNLLSGGSLGQMSVFALSIYPYITASIIVQLLTIAIPRLEELSKEGEEGKKKIARYTKIGAIILSFIQGWALVQGLFREAITENTTSVGFIILLSIVAGSMFLIWLGEAITEFGIGNGISMLILLGIISNVPTQVGIIWRDLLLGHLNWFSVVILLAIVVITLIIVIMINQGERKIPVQYAKRVVGRKMYGGQSTHIPVKVNMSGVMPVIFASAITSLPNTLALFFGKNLPAWYRNIFTVDSLSGLIVHTLVNALLIILFAYFYTAVQFNTVEYAKNLQQYGGFIPGIRPGKPTGIYLSRISNRITFIGALALAFVWAVPNLVNYALGIAIVFGGTSVIIIVGVILDTIQQMESMMTMRHYKGFLK